MAFVVVASRGMPVTESANGIGLRADVATNGFGIPVTIVSALGMPVIFYGPDGALWPGGVAPGGGGFPDNSTSANEYLFFFI